MQMSTEMKDDVPRRGEREREREQEKLGTGG